MFHLYLSSLLAVSLVSSFTAVVYVSRMAYVRPSLIWSCGVCLFNPVLYLYLFAYVVAVYYCVSLTVFIIRKFSK